MMEVYVSGIHSGPNPSSGLGIARSLRDAYPDARITGVDYSTASTGIHSPAFDDIWVQRQWNEINLDLFREQIARVLTNNGALWIPSLDVEIQWLVTVFPGDPRILVPPEKSLIMTRKPTFTGANQLPLKLPNFMLADKSNWDLYAFCRRHGWPVWCKGPSSEARLVWNWAEVRRAILDIQAVWKEGKPALQEHIDGSEESFTYSAFQGKLLDCVHMQKRLQTEEGKTWAGAIFAVPPDILKAIERTLAELQWTGGGEIEFVRDDAGNMHLIDWNPRFPAWIYGATLAGHNLPGMLAEAAGMGRARPAECRSNEFARVVEELPVRSGFFLPEPPPPGLRRIAPYSKHPSGMPLLAKRLAGEHITVNCITPTIPVSVMGDLARMDLWEIETPKLVYLPETARHSFQRLKAVGDISSELGVQVQTAYSVKTNPFPALMQDARENGAMAEVINSIELKHALASGFQPGQIILNGPAQGWPEDPVSQPLFAIFADSLERLRFLAEHTPGARYMGVRMKPPIVVSRFGIDLSQVSDYFSLTEILNHAGSPELGIHFHHQSDVVGSKTWWQAAEGMIFAASAIVQQSGHPVKCLDMGGGWFPEDLLDEFVARAPSVLKIAKDLLPELEHIIIEPGKALAQPTMALVSRVIEVRRPPKGAGHTSMVVDASVADLPMAPYFPHRVIAFFQDGTAIPLSDGEDWLLGRNCMETDVMSYSIQVPQQLQAGDIIVICDAGAYDATMSYEFAKGRIRNA